MLVKYQRTKGLKRMWVSFSWYVFKLFRAHAGEATAKLKTHHESNA